MKHDIFINYSRHDFEYALMFATYFEKEGLKTWIYTRDLRSSETEFVSEIKHAIDSCRCVVSLLSDAATKSHYVYSEIKYAESMKIPVVSILLDETVIPEILFYQSSLSSRQNVRYYENKSMTEVISAVRRACGYEERKGMSNEVYDIFISYRRKNAEGKSNVPDARSLYKEFMLRKYKTFFDYSDCTDNYFSETILPAIRTCKYFLLMLTSDGMDRCFSTGDWVRREIEEALKYKRKIVAVNINNACTIWPKLPPSLSKLDGLQITTIYDDHMFEGSIDYLVKNRMQLLLNNE